MKNLLIIISYCIALFLSFSCSPSFPGDYTKAEYISIILEGEEGTSVIPNFTKVNESCLELLGSETAMGLSIALMERGRATEACYILSLIEKNDETDFSLHASKLKSFFEKQGGTDGESVLSESGTGTSDSSSSEILKQAAMNNIISGGRDGFSDFIKPFLLLPADEVHNELLSAFESAGYSVENLDPSDRELVTAKMFLLERDYAASEELLKIVLKHGYGASEGVVEDLVTVYRRTGRLEEGAGFLSEYALNGTADIEGRSKLLLASGRMLRWAGRNREGREVLERALACNIEKDAQRIIWYLLDCGIKDLPSEASSLLLEYAPLWDEPYYFSDILESLLARFLRERRWELLQEVLPVVIEYADTSTVCQWLYVAGRLSEEEISFFNISGFTNTDQSGTGGMIIEKLFEKVIELDPSSYYSWLSRKRLGISVDTISPPGVKDLPDVIGTGAADPFMSGDLLPENGDFILFMMVETGYYSLGLRWFEDMYTGIPDNDRESILKLARKMQNDGKWLDSIRIISRLTPLSPGESSVEELILRYPRPYSDILEKTASKYNHNPALIFALVRAESGFTPEIESWAGAVGLMQLMPATAEDISSRMKLNGWDLKKPEDNLEMGCWYLDWLLGYVGELMPSVLAYNGGPGRIRGFLKELDYLPADLFPEALSMGETRRYGPKVLVSCIHYGYLYYGVSPETAITWFYPDL